MNKKLLSLGALILSVSTFASCTNPNNKVSFNENWLLDTTTSAATVGAKETLKYDVTFEKGFNADNEYRSVSYGNGSYTTVLQTELSEDGSEILYRYTTTLEIPVTIEHFATGEVLKNETNPDNPVMDVVTTEVLFHGKSKSLTPISSTKTIVSHSPTTSDAPQSLEGCYVYYNYTVSTVYNDDLSGKSTMINNAKENAEPTEVSFKPADEDYSTLDNEHLLLALRGIPNLSSHKFNVYNSSWRSSQLVAVTASTVNSDEFTINGEKRTVSYTPVTIKLDVKNSGEEQSVWIAETTNLTTNTYRNVILQMEIPIYYSYGSFIYTLSSAQYM